MSKFQPFPSTNCFATKLLGEGAAVLFISRSVLIHRGLCILNWLYTREKEKGAWLPLSSLLLASLLRKHFSHPLLPFGHLSPLSLISTVLAELGLCLSSQLFLNSLKKGVTGTFNYPGSFPGRYS